MQTLSILVKLKELFREFSNELEEARKKEAPKAEIDMLASNVQKIGNAILELEKADRKITDYLVEPTEENPPAS